MQRTDERERESAGVDVEALLDEDAGEAEGSQSGGRGLRGRVGQRLRPDLPRLFSLRGFLAALALAVGGWLAGGWLAGGPIPESVGGLLGMAAATFALGLAGRRRYLEVALAGAVAAGVSALANHLVLSMLAGLGPGVAVLGAGAGVLAAVVGHYFGRDLRDGLVRDL